MENKLYRDEQHKTIGGVCAGLATYFNVDISLVRVLFVLAAILGGGGVIGYIVLWIVIPNKPLYSPSDAFFTESQPKPPFNVAPVQKQLTTGRVAGGIILMLLGIYLLLEQSGLIPRIHFRLFFPVVLIAIGLVFMFGFWKQHPQPINTNTNPWDAKTTTTDDLTNNDNAQNI